MSKSRISRAVISLLIIISMTSCYESVEGCLDPEATNYTVEADDPCDDCCVLPSFSILMSYLVDGLSYTDGASFRVSSQGLMVEDFHFFICDIELLDPDGNEINYEDQLRLFDDMGDFEWITEDFKYYAPNQFRGILEGVRYDGILDKIQFKMGLREEINGYNRDSLELNTELSKVPDEVYQGNEIGYEFYSFQIRDTLDNFLELHINNDFPLIDVSIPIDGETLRRGFNDDVNLFIDFGLLFDGINLSVMDEDEVLTLIRRNFSSAFGKK